jgi:SAM-dependent methyltransferase
MAEKPGGAYIDDLPATAAGQGYYDLDATCEEYLAFHFPDGDPLAALLGAAAPPLEERYPFALRGLWQAHPQGRALDVGAATGRITFDLARDHREAWGVDLAATLVHGARAVQRSGVARYRTVLEGRLLEEHEVEVGAPSHARFAVASALALPFRSALFDTVVALNLVDRVPDPRRALDELARVTSPGGILLVASPYTWLESFTPAERWLGGFLRDGAPVRGPDSVRRHLSDAFALQRETRLPFFIPHHARSGQLGVAHIQIFQRER